VSNADIFGEMSSSEDEDTSGPAGGDTGAEGEAAAAALDELLEAQLGTFAGAQSAAGAGGAGAEGAFSRPGSVLGDADVGSPGTNKATKPKKTIDLGTFIHSFIDTTHPSLPPTIVYIQLRLLFFVNVSGFKSVIIGVKINLLYCRATRARCLPSERDGGPARADRPPRRSPVKSRALSI